LEEKKADNEKNRSENQAIEPNEDED